MADIMFSYAPVDAPRAQAVAEALKARGLDVDWDRTLLPGERYDAVIAKRLAEAKAVIVLWSNASVASNLVMDEAAMARDQGKLIPVRIDVVDSPIGFRQLQTGDLAGFPGPASAHALAALAEAVAHAAGGAAAEAPAWRPAPQPAAPPEPEEAVAERRLFTRWYWGWTAALSAFCGLLYFISPVGKAAMEDDVAQRIGVLIGSLLVFFLIFALARALLFVSRRWVGKSGGLYFTAEMWVLLGVAVAVALINTFQPSAGATPTGGGLVGLATQLDLAVVGVFLLFTPLIFVVRAFIRLVRGKPQPA